MPIRRFDPATSLSGFLDCIRQVRADWRVDEAAKTKGDETQLWYRGQDQSSWGLTPKVYRPEFVEADEDVECEGLLNRTR